MRNYYDSVIFYRVICSLTRKLKKQYSKYTRKSFYTIAKLYNMPVLKVIVLYCLLALGVIEKQAKY